MRVLFCLVIFAFLLSYSYGDYEAPSAADLGIDGTSISLSGKAGICFIPTGTSPH